MFKNKEKAHLWISFAKSLIRIIGAFAFIGLKIEIGGAAFLIAEVLGVWEEIVVQ